MHRQTIVSKHPNHHVFINAITNVNAVYEHQCDRAQATSIDVPEEPRTEDRSTTMKFHDKKPAIRRWRRIPAEDEISSLLGAVDRHVHLQRCIRAGKDRLSRDWILKAQDLAQLVGLAPTSLEKHLRFSSFSSNLAC